MILPPLPPREPAAPARETPAAATPALRLGGLTPLFPPAGVADPGLLRLGGLSPLFGRA